MDSAILVNEALKLPALERAQLIDVLWSSLDPAERNAIDNGWLLESQDRLAAFRAGQVTAIDGEEALRGTLKVWTGAVPATPMEDAVETITPLHSMTFVDAGIMVGTVPNGVDEDLK